MSDRTAVIDIDDSKIVQQNDKLGFSTVVYGFAKFINLPSLGIENYRGIDLGSGVGSLSIVLLKKFKNLCMTGVDIDSESVELSRKSGVLSKVGDRFSPVCCDIREIDRSFKGENYHLLVSNPPYFKKGKGRISPKRAMARAKHEIDGNMEDFIRAAKYLMKPSAFGYILQHVWRFQELIVLLGKYEFIVSRVQFIYTNGSCDAKNIMVEFKKKYSGDISVLPPLTLRDGIIVDGA